MRDIAVHLVLALVGLSSAWWVWTHEQSASADSDQSVELLECSPERLDSVLLESGERDALLEARGEGEARTWWMKVTRRPPTGEPVTVEFVTSEAIDELLEKIAPFTALRLLGDVEDDVLSELGLSEPEVKITVRCGERKLELGVGETVFGTRDRYMRKRSGGPAYLVSGELVQRLQSAELQLMQRDLHAFEMTAVARLEVQAYGASRALLQRNHRDPQQALWVDAADPERRNDLYGNWIGQLGQLSALSYLPRDAEPGSDLETSAPVSPVMTLRWLDADGQQAGQTELVTAASTPATYYARTEATRSWVRVPPSLAREVEDGARSVVGLPPLERPRSAPVVAPPGSPPGAPSPIGDPHAGHGHPLPVPEGVDPHAPPAPRPHAGEAE